MEQRATVIGAFAVVYVIWGSTYLAIDLAIATIPPLWAASLRFLAAGALMLAWARARGSAWPTRRDVLDATVVGLLMLAIGNGALNVAETKMPTGIAALLVATVSLWLVAFESIQMRRWPHAGVLLGIAVGIAGIGLLAGVDAGWSGGRVDPWFVILMLAGAAAWALGSLQSRRSGIESMRMRVGTQMLGGAAGLIVAALVWDAPLQFSAISTESWLALLYLITAGSFAFTCYIWLLRTVSAAAVGTYAFVNPLVALALGFWWLGEPITVRAAFAGALILVAVLLINRTQATATVRR